MVAQYDRQADASTRSADVSAVACIPVSSRRDLARFIRTPRLIYRGMPGFVPRLDFGERHALDPKLAPFFLHGTAQYWLALQDDGRIVGRISAQIDRLQTESFGMFGCLDSIDDADVVRALLRQAEAWLRHQGQTKARGPFCHSINGESGLLIEGQSAPSMTLMPWHPKYLASHLAAAGYSDVKTLLSYAMDLERVRYAAAAASFKRPQLSEGVRFRALDPREPDRDAKIITDVFNDAWQDNWGFVPLMVEEIKALISALRALLPLDWVIIAEVGDEPIGVALLVPNVAEVTGNFEGRLLPLNWTQLLYRAWRKDFRSARLIIFGVVRKLRRTALGVTVPFAMLSEYARRAERYPVREIEMSWVLEDNWPMRRIIERLGGTVDKRYAVFEKHLSD